MRLTLPSLPRKRTPATAKQKTHSGFAAEPLTASLTPAQPENNAHSKPPANRVEHLVEFTTSAGLSPRIDADRGVIHGVKVLGLSSRNGRKYRTACVSAAAPLYEGIKVNVNHSRGRAFGPRDYQDRLGCLREVRAADQGLFADLHFNPRHAIAEQLLWDAQHAPENVGLSHNVEARTSRIGRDVIVEEILLVNCVDLVSDPATTTGLFESLGVDATQADWERIEALLEELLERSPDLVAQSPGKSAALGALLRAGPLAGQSGYSSSQPISMNGLSPEFQQLLEGIDPELANEFRRERLAWQRSFAARPKSQPQTATALREQTDARGWVRRIT